MMMTTTQSDNMPASLSLKEIKAALRRLRDEKTPVELEAAAARLLSFRFLSEVERLTDEQGLNRRELARALGTSPSYVTQLYRGDRLLNLTMAVRMERVLGVQFQVRAEALVVQAQAEAHPVMLQKLPRALSGRQFAKEQLLTGGQQAPYIIADAASAAA